MPLVYIHGVSVRKEHDYYQPSEKTRDELFRQLALANIVSGIKPKSVAISNPYWGGDAAKLAWDGLSLPRADAQAFGAGDAVLSDVADEVAVEVASSVPGQVDDGRVLLKLARNTNLARIVDLLWSTAALNKVGNKDPEELGRLGAKALRYAVANPQPAWLASVGSDDAFIEKLLLEVSQWNDPEMASAEAPADQAFGASEIWEYLKDRAKKLGNAVVAKATSPVVQLIRPALNDKITLFVGDVFCYLRSRERNDSNCPIVKTVGAALSAAHAQRSPSDPLLIVVGHSMGGNIAYDLLTHFLKDTVQCDLLLTVGSQVALFEELKLFVVSDPNVKKGEFVPRPANVKRWINVFDRADVFAYQTQDPDDKTQKVFADVEDFGYSTGETVVAAHGAYLLQPQFHHRLNVRIRRLNA